MRKEDFKLPSNSSFGFLFAAIFMAVSMYFFFLPQPLTSLAFAALSICFALVSMVWPDRLLPLNRAWMKLGLLLGIVVSPIVLGIIFFLILTPLAILQRWFGRDELRLRKVVKSQWSEQSTSDQRISDFTKQY
ncbi:hypothetical protein HKCCA1058_05990 [Rhodobacterales bacterium HKCCA1058]|nr:hypothetical protein [Rhodobacterales bacterium HKCCA1058]